MSDLLEEYRLVSRQVAAVVAGIGVEQLGESTPCTGWTVRDVLNHMGHSARTIIDIARGGPFADPAGPGEDRVGDDPVAGWADIERWMVDTFSDPDVLALEMDHPARRIDGADVLVILAFDHMIHAWDLLSATGQDVSLLSPESVEWVWGQVDSGRIEIVDSQRDTGRFGPAQPEAGTTLEQLLRYSGRQP